MWIDIQVGPWVMVLLWSALSLVIGAMVYAFARVAEHAIAHNGEMLGHGGDAWGWSDVAMGIFLALVLWFAMMLTVGAGLLHWLHQIFPVVE